MGDDGDKETEIKKEEPKSELKPEFKPDAKPEVPPAPPTDFKVAEIWIRSGNIMLDALPEFWKDKVRAIGMLEFCKDIVKEAKLPAENRIIPAKGSFINGVRNMFNKRRK